MSTKRQHIVTLVLLLSAPLFLMGVSSVFGEEDSQGYGYGYGACTADAPTRLRVKNQPRRQKVVMQWKKVTFENCDASAPDYYDVQVRNLSDKVLFSFSNVEKTRKVVRASLFKPNKRYRFAVRAVAVDAEATDYSRSKIFTVAPKRPGLITLEHQSSTEVHASWKNVARSKKLKYYRVLLKNGNVIVLDTKVRADLGKRRAGITLEDLTPNTTYTLSVRSFRKKGIYSAYRTRIFRTLP